MSVTYTTVNGQIIKENRNGVNSSDVPDTFGSTAMLGSSSGTVTDTFTYWTYGRCGIVQGVFGPLFGG